jgi:glycosyltransferase involved in cell wall biosynthesis
LQAVESILGQTFGDFEFLVEDSSTDGTTEILERYAARDPRIRVEIQPKHGVAAALNGLIDRARGEFIARMDADDVALPERFARQVEHLRAHPECVLVGSRVRIIDLEGDPLCDWCTMQRHEEIESSYLRGARVTAMSHPSVMMRREAVLAVGKYRPSVVEDIDLFLRLAEYGRIANLPEVLLRYRIHADNVSRTASFGEKLERDLAGVIRDARRRRKLLEAGDPPAEPAPTEPFRAEPSPTDEHETWAWWALGSGHVSSARKHARRVLSRAPLSLRSWRLMYCALRGH